MPDSLKRPLRTRSMLAPIAIFIFALLIAALGGQLRSSTTQIDRAAGETAVLAVPDLARFVRESDYDRVKVLPLDERLTRVTFFAGRKVLLDAAVARDGSVEYTQIYGPGYVRSGAKSVQRPLALLALGALFGLMTLSMPIRRVANFDVLALLALAFTIHMLNERLFELSVWIFSAALLYLMARCCWIGFGREREREPERNVEPDSRSIAGSRTLLTWGLIGSAALAVLVVIPGGQVGDVAYASMSGATQLSHGVSPYGNVASEILHGDTYPFLIYLMYLPAALIAPVRDVFDSADGALWVALIALIVGGVAIFTAVRRLAGDVWALRQTIAWIVFPPILITASSGSNDVLVGALIAVGVAAIMHAGRSSTALAMAAWMKVVPVLILPMWIARLRGAARIRALIAVGSVTAIVVLVMLIVAGTGSIGDMLHAISFQASRGSVLSLWTSLDAPVLQVLFQALVLMLVFVAAAMAWRDAVLAHDARRLCALAAAITIGMQLAGNYWSYAYLPWVYPFLAAALLWPRGEHAAEVSSGQTQQRPS